jgi:FeS assembly SUF system regulator
MIRLTKMTDYSLVIMTYCATHQERPIHTTKELATGTHLPLPTVGKILKQLAREGLMHSHRGVKGGYALARKPEQISIAEVITALDGPIAITDCSTETTDRCEIECMCPVSGNWQLINEAVRSALGNLTLADLARPLPKPLPQPLLSVYSADSESTSPKSL